MENITIENDYAQIWMEDEIIHNLSSINKHKLFDWCFLYHI